MQTSCMHPPFGLRCSICAQSRRTIKTPDIYRGAVPFVAIQLILVAVIIAFPSLMLLDTTQRQDRTVVRAGFETRNWKRRSAVGVEHAVNKPQSDQDTVSNGASSVPR